MEILLQIQLSKAIISGDYKGPESLRVNYFKIWLEEFSNEFTY